MVNKEDMSLAGIVTPDVMTALRRRMSWTLEPVSSCIRC